MIYCCAVAIDTGSSSNIILNCNLVRLGVYIQPLMKKYQPLTPKNVSALPETFSIPLNISQPPPEISQSI